MRNSFIPTDGLPHMPLLVLLHGGGGSADEQIDVWASLAQKEKIILSAPTSLDGWWTDDNDAQEVIEKIRHAATDSRVNPQKIYIVGHSLGAAMALNLGLAPSNFFAAVAAHSPTPNQILKTPISSRGGSDVPIKIWVGSEGADVNWFWGCKLQHDFKELHNIDVALTVVEGHRHNDYYRNANLISEIWSFLKSQDRCALQAPEW